MLEYIDWDHWLTSHTEDGKEMRLDLDKMRITQVVEELDRHSRQLARKEELTGN
jgi:large subunit ribosomal protein L53